LGPTSKNVTSAKKCGDAFLTTPLGVTDVILNLVFSKLNLCSIAGFDQPVSCSKLHMEFEAGPEEPFQAGIYKNAKPLFWLGLV